MRERNAHFSLLNSAMTKAGRQIRAAGHGKSEESGEAATTQLPHGISRENFDAPVLI